MALVCGFHRPLTVISKACTKYLHLNNFNCMNFHWRGSWLIWNRFRNYFFFFNLTCCSTGPWHPWLLSPWGWIYHSNSLVWSLASTDEHIKKVEMMMSPFADPHWSTSATLRIRVPFWPALVTQKVGGCLKWVRSFVSFQRCEIRSTLPVPQRPQDIRLWYSFINVSINVSKATEANRISRFAKKNMFLLKKETSGQDLCIRGLWCLTSNVCCLYYLCLCLTKTDRQTERQMG